MSEAWRGASVTLLVIAVFGLLAVAPAGGAAPAPGAADPAAAANATASNCSSCHAYLVTNRTPRKLTVETPDHSFELEHGDGRFWCLTCHAPGNRNRLVLFNGSTVGFGSKNATPLCAQCHGPVYDDWKEHIHGTWEGSWKDGTPKKYCVDCHDPHGPAFGTLTPAPPPEQPPDPLATAGALLPDWYALAFGVVLVIGVGLVGYAASTVERDQP